MLATMYAALGIGLALVKRHPSGYRLTELGETLLDQVLRDEYEPLLKLIYDCPVPTLCAVNGAAAGDTVVVPFCGSGTVLVEARLSGRRAIGVDANPLATELAGLKTRGPPATDMLERTPPVLARIPSAPGAEITDENGKSQGVVVQSARTSAAAVTARPAS